MRGVAAQAGRRSRSSPRHDTAGSVKLIQEQGLRHAAAIAGERAAELLWHGHPAPRVRGRKEPTIPALSPRPRAGRGRQGEAKTSLAFAGKNEPGLLFRCLSAFALRDIDLCKIESRPLRGVPWEYIFYLDFAGSASQERCRRALDHLREMATFVRVLGSYPRAPRTIVEQ